MLEPLKPRQERYYKAANDQDNIEENKGADESSAMPPRPGIDEQQLLEEYRKDVKKQKSSSDSFTKELHRLLDEESNKNSKKWRDQLRSFANELVADIEENQKKPSGEPSTRRIEYNLCKAKWKIAGPDSINDAEINFTDFKGVHDFTADGRVKSQISLENMYVTSDKPSSDATHFQDPTVIIKTVLGEKRSPCQRCGFDFDRSSNEVNSCVFHPGQFKDSSIDGSIRWTCCRSSLADAIGCAARPHTGSEKAVDIRFEAFPRVVEGLTMYKFIEANVYPGVTHTTIVQLTRSLAKSFMNYFLGNADDLVLTGTKELRPGAQNIHRTGSDTSGDSIQFSSHSDLSALSAPDRDDPSHTERRKLLLFGGTSNKRDPESAIDSSSSHSQQTVTTAPAPTKEKAAQTGEIVFLQNWNIGDININLSVAGFHKIIDIYDLPLVISDFSRRYKIGTVHHILKKFVAHLVKHLLSSGLGILKVKLSGRPVKISESDLKQTKDSNLAALEEGEESEEHAVDLLLALPTKKKKKHRWLAKRKDQF